MDQGDLAGEAIRLSRQVGTDFIDDGLHLLPDHHRRKPLPQGIDDLLPRDLYAIEERERFREALLQLGFEDAGEGDVMGVGLAQDGSGLGGRRRLKFAQADAHLEAVRLSQQVGRHLIESPLDLGRRPHWSHGVLDRLDDPLLGLISGPKDEEHPPRRLSGAGPRFAHRVANPRIDLLLEQPVVGVVLAHERFDLVHQGPYVRGGVDGQCDLVPLSGDVLDDLQDRGGDECFKVVGGEGPAHGAGDPWRGEAGGGQRVGVEVCAEVVRGEGARFVEGGGEDIDGDEAVDVFFLQDLWVVVWVQEAAVEPEISQRHEEGRHEGDAHGNEGYPAENRHAKAPSCRKEWWRRSPEGRRSSGDASPPHHRGGRRFCQWPPGGRERAGRRRDGAGVGGDLLYFRSAFAGHGERAPGDIAQLGERRVRNAEAGGSNPPISTTPHTRERRG